MSNRAFGVEIECYAPDGYEDSYGDREDGVSYSYDLLRNNEFQSWANLVTSDDSLGSCGAEIKSPVLQGKEGFSELKRVMEFLVERDYYVEYDCGFHVHLDAPEYKDNPRLTIKTVKAWMRNQHLVNNMVDSTRLDNDNCPIWDETDLFRLEQYISDRYFLASEGSLRGAINFGSLPYHGTVEIRQHEGTLNYEEAESWIKFCQAFIDSVSGTTIQRMSKEELLLKRLKVEKNASKFLTTKARINKERRKV